MEYIGREVAKTFKNHGTFKGKVLDYDKQHGFHVEYEDGDSEDMKESDLLKILTKTMRLDGPACLSGMSRRSTPRCETVPQYLQMARHAALTLAMASGSNCSFSTYSVIFLITFSGMFSLS